MIPFEDYIEHAPTEVGEQVAIDHVNCSAGTDMRGRLYIKRASEELVLAYCHNCADKGYYVCGYSNVSSYRNKEGKSEAPVPDRGVGLPSGLERGYPSWPKEARIWASAYLNTEDIHYMGMYYWPAKRRVLVPFRSYGQGLAGFQTRKVFVDDPYPKYLTELSWARGSRFYVPFATPDPLEREVKHTIVICEDMISAYKLYVAGYDPYCLCGGHFDINEFYRDQQRLLPDTKKITVWLDNDNREIRQLAKRTRELLALTYPLLAAKQNITWVRDQEEPKQCANFSMMIVEPNE
jgi:hypothetical protein